MHLPSYALLPTTQWQPGTVIKEQFDLELPADLPIGRYVWRSGWYDLSHSEAYATDERSRIGADIVLFSIDVPADDSIATQP